MNTIKDFSPFDLYVESRYATVTHICGICGTGYTCIPWGGYCDESMECACDDGYSLVTR